MLRISLNALVLTAGALFLSYITLQYFDTRKAGGVNPDSGNQIGFVTSISHPSLLGGTTQRTFIKVDLTGFKITKDIPKTPVNVAIVLDKSGSMNGEKMMQAKNAALQAVSRLSEGDVVSIITYDNTAQVLLPATEFSQIQQIEQKISQVTAGGGTALYDGVVTGANQIREFLADNRVNRVILLSDGQANHGPETPDALGSLGASLIQDGISVSTIGLGLGYNEDLMVALAMRSDGNHHFVEHADMLAGMFNQEFGDVLSVVAQDVRVSINLAPGIRPISVLGREASIDGRQVDVSLNQLYSEQEKYVLLEVETSGEKTTGTYKIADVSLAYANMLTQAEEHHAQSISATFTNSMAEVEEAVDKKTMVSAIEQRAVLNEEQAIGLRDMGQLREAEALLQENAVYLEQNAATYEADVLLEKAERSRGVASSLDDVSWKSQRKQLRSDHYKVKTQQKN
ncbi:MAG: VWA domain-containing protein [Bacteroidota bacterium]